MRKSKLFFFISLVINIILVSYFISTSKLKGDSHTKNQVIQDKDLSVQYNFKKIFIEKNDSVYKRIFSLAFENNPVQAYLLSCTYYTVTKDTTIKKDIKMIGTEIKAIYGSVPNIEEVKWEPLNNLPLQLFLQIIFKNKGIKKLFNEFLFFAPQPTRTFYNKVFGCSPSVAAAWALTSGVVWAKILSQQSVKLLLVFLWVIKSYIGQKSYGGSWILGDDA